MAKKAALIRNLEHKTYCRLAASKLHGVGVVAVRDIPSDVNPFQSSSGKDVDVVLLTGAEVERLSAPVKKMIKDYCGYDKKKDKWGIPSDGFNNINITFYMNHSKKPNIGVFDTGKRGLSLVTFKTLRAIKAGEELLIDYNT